MQSAPHGYMQNALHACPGSAGTGAVRGNPGAAVLACKTCKTLKIRLSVRGLKTCKTCKTGAQARAFTRGLSWTKPCLWLRTC